MRLPPAVLDTAMTHSFSATAVLLAAGGSTRMVERERKPFLLLEGRTVLERAVAAFDAARQVQEIVLVARAEDFERIDELLARGALSPKVNARAVGGEERTDSVRLGVQAASAELDVVLVHDVARPLVRSAEIDAVVSAAARAGAALLAVPVRDTLKVSADGGRARETLERSRIWAAQTPQGFRTALLRELLDKAAAEGFRPTDDAALYERYVGPIPIVEGRQSNIKLTTPEDLAIARAILAATTEAGKP